MRAPTMLVSGVVAVVFSLALVSAAEDESLSLSVRWYAPFFSGGGYCSEATAFVGALSEVVTLSVEQHGDGYNSDYVAGCANNPAFKAVVALSRKKLRRPPDVTVCHSEPGAWHVLRGPSWSSSACPASGAAYVVGRTMFETDRLPDGWPQRLNAVDELWVPTEFQAAIFREAGVEKPVRVVGEPVDTTQFTPDGPLYDISGFVVVSVFKWEHRKGWDVLLRAWHRAFSEGATLVLVTNAYHSDDAFRAKLEKFVIEDMGVTLAALCPIVVLSRLPQAELEALYRRADLLAMPTRGEGWGRPHVEAMSSGTPVAATNWSGPTAYLTPENGYPIGISAELETIKEGPFKGHKWASPDADHLAAILRAARDDPAERRAKGGQARLDMVAKFSPVALAAELREILADIKKKQGRVGDDRQHSRRERRVDL